MRVSSCLYALIPANQSAVLRKRKKKSSVNTKRLSTILPQKEKKSYETCYVCCKLLKDKKVYVGNELYRHYHCAPLSANWIKYAKKSKLKRYI